MAESKAAFALAKSLSGPSFGNVDLTDCDREPIRIPGSIQSHGVLLAVNPMSMSIVQVAGDTERLLGVTREQLFDQSLTSIVGAAVLIRLQAIIDKQRVLPRPFLIIEAEFNRRPFEMSAHLSDGLMILELETRPQYVDFDGIELVQAMAAQANATQSLAQLLTTVVDVVGAASGFDRVMLYRFSEDDSGHVIAEHRRSPTVESFLDLHYPASDIPVQARELYCNNWIRSIPDVGYQPQPLYPPDNPTTGRPLDLSFSALRSVSPVHLEYLSNMGIAASMSLSLVVQGKLWGLIACHHNQPLYLGARTRAALELFAQLVSRQIHDCTDLAEAKAGIHAREVQARLVDALTRFGLPQVLSTQYDQLELIQTPGTALLVKGEISLRGNTPTRSEIEGLRRWLDSSGESGVYATDRLSEHYPPAAAFLESAAGLLALSTSRTPRDYVLWFLPELVGTVSWAGEPTKTKAYGPLGDRLTPRKSFAAWTETVKGRSRPWAAVEIESARALRSAIVVADLELRVAQRTKALEDANGALQSIVEQRESLIDELQHAELVKDEFVSTVNHELRTPLTAIFGALRLLGATTAGKLDPKSERLLEVAQISCNQLTALVNDILDIEKIAAGKIDYQMETLPAGPLIQGIIVRNSAIADAYGVHFKMLLKLEGLALRVDPNRFSQAFVNLLSNAAKYSPFGAVVSIVAKRHGEAAIRISVTDQGPGIPKAFRSKIFGRFAQADNSTTRQVGGSGLGLNITKSLIEAFGGTVSFDSVEGRGATFHFILPCYNSTTTELELQAHG